MAKKLNVLNKLRKALNSKTVMAVIALVAFNEPTVASTITSAIQVPEAYQTAFQSVVSGLVGLVAIYGRINPRVDFTNKK